MAIGQGVLRGVPLDLGGQQGPPAAAISGLMIKRLEIMSEKAVLSKE